MLAKSLNCAHRMTQNLITDLVCGKNCTLRNKQGPLSEPNSSSSHQFSSSWSNWHKYNCWLLVWSLALYSRKNVEHANTGIFIKIMHQFDWLKLTQWPWHDLVFSVDFEDNNSLSYTMDLITATWDNITCFHGTEFMLPLEAESSHTEH